MQQSEYSFAEVICRSCTTTVYNSTRISLQAYLILRHYTAAKCSVFNMVAFAVVDSIKWPSPNVFVLRWSLVICWSYWLFLQPFVTSRCTSRSLKTCATCLCHLTTEPLVSRRQNGLYCLFGWGLCFISRGLLDHFIVYCFFAFCRFCWMSVMFCPM